MENSFETVVTELIVQAGDARSLALQAVREGRRQNWDEVDRLMKECDSAMVKAHEVQTELIQRELNGVPVNMNLLMVHAQDHVMNAMTVRDLAAEMLSMLGSRTEY